MDRNDKNKKSTAHLTKEIISVNELTCLLGIRKRMVERLVMMDVIEPVCAEPELCFSVKILPTLKKIRRIHYELGVSWTSIKVVLDLMDKIEDMEERSR